MAIYSGLSILVAIIAIAVILLGLIIVVALTGLLIFYFVKRRKR